MREAARSPRPAPDTRPPPSRARPAAPAQESESAQSRSRRFAQPEPLPPGAPRPPAAPCDPLAVSAALCAPWPAAASNPYPSSASADFRSSGSPFPHPPLQPVAFPSQPPSLVGFTPSRPQPPRIAPSLHAIASRRSLSRPSYSPSARDAPLPAACRLLPLPAPPSCARPPLPTSGLSRSPPVPHRPNTGERCPGNEPSEYSLRVRLRRTRSK